MRSLLVVGHSLSERVSKDVNQPEKKNMMIIWNENGCKHMLKIQATNNYYAPQKKKNTGESLKV